MVEVYIVVLNDDICVQQFNLKHEWDGGYIYM